MPRIALIHALADSLAPIEAEFRQAWPEALRMNLLDDSLSADLARAATAGGGLDAAMQLRFDRLADYAVASGADGLLFTCSAFGPCIDAVKRRLAPRPVLQPYEAMVDEAVLQARALGGRIGLVASFAPTLAAMPASFPDDAPLELALAEGALAALQAGRPDEHDARVAEAAAGLAARGCGLIALAQFSLARAAPVVGARCGLPVLTKPASELRRLRAALAACAP